MAAETGGAWQELLNGRERLIWPVDRRKCGLWTIGIALYTAAALWFSITIAPELVDTSALEPELHELTGTLTAVSMALIFGGIGVFGLVEYVRLAMTGGALALREAGLSLRLMGQERVIPWAAVGEVGLEWARGSQRVVVELRGWQMRWPLALALFGSRSTRLAVAANIFADPADEVAAGIAMGRDRLTATAPALTGGGGGVRGGRALRRGERPRRSVKAAVFAVLWGLFGVAGLYRIVVEAGAGNWPGVLVAIVFTVVGGVVGALIWLGAIEATD